MSSMFPSSWRGSTPAIPPAPNPNLHRTVNNKDTKDTLKTLLVEDNLPEDGNKPILLARLQMHYLGWRSPDHEEKMARYFTQNQATLRFACHRKGLSQDGTIPEMCRRLVLAAKEEAGPITVSSRAVSATSKEHLQQQDTPSRVGFQDPTTLSHQSPQQPASNPRGLAQHTSPSRANRADTHDVKLEVIMNILQELNLAIEDFCLATRSGS